jgi:succinate dehydrogenase assembly factor 1
MAPGTRRVTGLQRQVYNLYRRSLQLIASKPEVSSERHTAPGHADPRSLRIDQHTRPSWHLFIHHQFRHPTLGGGIRRKDVGAIEYLIRRGDKMLEGYKGQGTTSVSGVPQDPGPEREEYAAGGQLGWIAKGGKHGSWRRRQNDGTVESDQAPIS